MTDPVDGTTPVIQIEALGKSFGLTKALQGVTLHVNPGEVVGLIGDNGAGKSTFIKILSGFERPDEGRILVDGTPVSLKSASEARAMGIETVYQEQALADDLSVMNNLFLGSELTRRVGPFVLLDQKRMEREAQEMLDLLRLRVSPSQEARFCSGGEKQGIAIARAIHVKARLVILDEPTNALGVVAVDRVLDLIRELKRTGIACIFISHNIQHVMDVSDRVTMFVHGTKILDVPVKETTTMQLVDMLNSKSGSRT
jgi:simple sugar transport system ATP-binding protein